jgi:hypothetical protein
VSGALPPRAPRAPSVDTRRQGGLAACAAHASRPAEPAAGHQLDLASCLCDEQVQAGHRDVPSAAARLVIGVGHGS